MATLAFAPAVRTDLGRRENNEDAAFASERLAAIADGVGGHAAGEVASGAVINALIALDKRWLTGRLEDALADAVAFGNDTIGFIASCRPELAGMGTTLTAIALADDGRYVLANVGDSRTYLLRDGELIRLTRDDSLVQLLIDGGELSAEEASRHPHRSVVLAALDGAPRAAPTLSTFAARAGDRLLLCSDGLSDVVDDETIASTLNTVRPRRACAERLIALALDAGGRDNVSVVIADVVAGASQGPGWIRNMTSST